MTSLSSLLDPITEDIRLGVEPIIGPLLCEERASSSQRDPPTPIGANYIAREAQATAYRLTRAWVRCLEKAISNHGPIVELSRFTLLPICRISEEFTETIDSLVITMNHLDAIMMPMKKTLLTRDRRLPFKLSVYEHHSQMFVERS